MTDEQFKALCNTYGFAPSRALRELIDCAVARQEILEEVTAQRDALLEALKLARLMLVAHGETHAKIDAAIAAAEIGRNMT
jgi:hypothetical protein